MLPLQAASPSVQKDLVEKKLVYLVSDVRIAFWEIMSRGVRQRAHALGYEVTVLSAENHAEKELRHMVETLKQEVAGIIVSPTNSSACVTLLKLAKRAGIPVVIADIGTEGGEYVAYIASDNRLGAYQIGKVLAKRMQTLGWEEGRVGIVAIPQKRFNGQARTAGFMQAMEEAGIKGATIKQQVDFSYEETYTYVQEMMKTFPDLRAVWLQGSNRYQGALDAIVEAQKQDDILLICFDAEPEFLDLIPQGVLVGAAMQQPYLMGQEAVGAMDRHLRGASVQKHLLLPILAISADNVVQQRAIIQRNVLGIEEAVE